MNNILTTDILVVGGGAGGAAAAIQAARRGVKTILVSEFSWLGGMLTSAGVAAPDGNELLAFQTGMWGAFLRELQQRQIGGLDNSWVSFFSYDPRIGAQIFADWARSLSNLKWISGQVPLEVLRQENTITGVRFADFTVHAQVILDGTELGDLLSLGDVPYRWGWEWQSQLNEPSAPTGPNDLTAKYPVQSPTWVVIMQDFGEEAAPEIPASPLPMGDFAGAWQGYSPERFLNYGRLPGNLLMINWPQCGNDYGEGAGRLVESETARQEFLQESRWHSQNFAHFIQTQLGRRYGLANNIFPSGELKTQGRQGDTAPTSFALHPYYRESRRVVGLTTIREPDILPVAGGRVANLPVDAKGKISAIAIGNYANDHHYPNYDFPLQSKSIRWGGRWTGTPFTIPYGSLIPAEVDGLLVCEKNISVSHIANGATRLQPVVLGIGQAAGMAAALCIQRGCQPRDLPVRVLQEALLADPQSAAAIIPLFNLPPDSPDWLQWQRYYLDNPDVYPTDGNYPGLPESSNKSNNSKLFSGIFQRQNEQDYIFTLNDQFGSEETWKLVTLQAEVDQQLQTCLDQQFLKVWGRLNSAGNWLLVEKID